MKEDILSHSLQYKKQQQLKTIRIEKQKKPRRGKKNKEKFTVEERKTTKRKHKTKKQTNKNNNERDTSTERIYPQKQK